MGRVFIQLNLFFWRGDFEIFSQSEGFDCLIKMLAGKVYHIVSLEALECPIYLSLIEYFCIKHWARIVLGIHFHHGRTLQKGQSSWILLARHRCHGGLITVDGFRIDLLEGVRRVWFNFFRGGELHVSVGVVFGIDRWSHVKSIRRWTEGILSGKTISSEPVHWL